MINLLRQPKGDTTLTLLETLARDRVRDLAINEPLQVGRDCTIANAIDLMQSNRTGCILVTEDNHLLGLFTERDVLKRVLAQDTLTGQSIESVMTPDPDTLRLTDTISDVIQRMNSGGFRHMPVMDDSGQPIGVLSVKRVVQYLVEHFPEAIYNLPPDPNSIPSAREGG